MIATIEVPAGGPCFEGHFPGRPILPGVTEITLVLDAIAREARRPVPVRGIGFARLRQLVFPGDHLELVAREQDATRLRFDLKRGGDLVANGEFLLGPPETPRGMIPPATRAKPATPEQSLDDLLPHRGPMLFLTAILQLTADGLVCAARIPGGCALVCGGSAPVLAAIEAAAQAAGAWEALQRSRHTGIASPRIGYLVAMREVVFFSERVAADRELRVSVSLEAAAPPLTHYRIEAMLEGMPLARGTIATFLAN